MAPFLNGFRHNLNEELRKAAEKSPLKIELSEFSKKDLRSLADPASEGRPATVHEKFCFGFGRVRSQQQIGTEISGEA
jgi:hypothetical protein